MPGLQALWGIKKMKFKKTDIIAVLVVVASLVHLIIAYPSLPAQVVTNWGFNGDVEYSSKSTLWLLWVINAGMIPLFFIIPKIDPKGKSYAKVDGFYTYFRLVMVIFLALMMEITILSADDPYRFDVGKIVVFAVSLLFIFIGNYLPKCKQSFTMGIKTMWTLSDERVWNKTHRLGGVLFVISGVVMLVAALFFGEKVMFAVTMVASLGTLIATTVYSYLLYRKYNQ